MIENSISSNMKKGFLNSFSLKMIAIISMLIDHIGAFIIEEILYIGNKNELEFEYMFQIYNIMRSFGRIAFPIFCFLLIIGYEKTHDIKKYLFRLFIFAFVSEIPFDLAQSNQILEFSYQNVFFTLFLGLFSIYISEKIYSYFIKKDLNQQIVKYMIFILIFTISGYISFLLRTDYSYNGILLILILYFSRKNKFSMAVALFFGLFFEIYMPFVLVSIPIILLYNGKKGKNIKYFFYFFYPVHLFVLYLIKNMILTKV